MVELCMTKWPFWDGHVFAVIVIFVWQWIAVKSSLRLLMPTMQYGERVEKVDEQLLQHEKGVQCKVGEGQWLDYVSNCVTFLNLFKTVTISNHICQNDNYNMHVYSKPFHVRLVHGGAVPLLCDQWKLCNTWYNANCTSRHKQIWQLLHCHIHLPPAMAA